MRQSWETMTSNSAGHIILTPTQPVGSGRPQRGSNPGPPDQESRALPTELPRPPTLLQCIVNWKKNSSNGLVGPRSNSIVLLKTECQADDIKFVQTTVITKKTGASGMAIHSRSRSRILGLSYYRIDATGYPVP